MGPRQLIASWPAIGLIAACDIRSAHFKFVEQTYLKSSAISPCDYLGYSVALSGDGSTLAAGAPNDGNSSSCEPYQSTNAVFDREGAVYVFTRSNDDWGQPVQITASNRDVGDAYGSRVVLSGDGATLAVGAWFEGSANPADPADNSSAHAGAVYVYERIGTKWTETAYLKASHPRASDFLGFSLALSGDGSTLAVGEHGDDSGVIGIVPGDETLNISAVDAGAVHVFHRTSSSWSQTGHTKTYIKPSHVGAGDLFGVSVALSADGTVLAVGAPGEDSSAITIDGDMTDDGASNSGAVYVFVRDDETWKQQSYIKAFNAGAEDQFGIEAALSADGSTLAVGAWFEDSSGDPSDDSASSAGATYVFTRDASTWKQQGYIKPSNAGAGDQLGEFGTIALSGDGSLLVVGAGREDSSATRIGGNENDNTAEDAGAVYIFARNDSLWSQQVYVKAANAGRGDNFCTVALSADTSIMAIGAWQEDSSTAGIRATGADELAPGAGAVYAFR